MALGVRLVLSHNVVGFDRSRVVLQCRYSSRHSTLPAAQVVSVTSRLPNDELYQALLGQADAMDAAGIVSVSAIGDCLAPGTIAAAVYAGHRYAREYDLADEAVTGFRREFPN